MKNARLQIASFALALGVAAGCSLRADDAGEARAAPIREIERRAVGKARAYPADVLTEADGPRQVLVKMRERFLIFEGEEHLPQFPQMDSVIK